MGFSQRLAWGVSENRLAVTEAALRGSGRPLFDLTISNPTLADLPYPAEAIARAFAEPAMARYRPSPRGLPSATAAVAADYARRGATVGDDSIFLTASSSESYGLLFKLLGDPGQAVLVPEPSYPLFDYLARLDGLLPRPYRLAFDGRWHLDFSSLAWGDVAAVVVVSPNNPTGSYLGGEDWHRLAELAAEHGVAVIVDEVFADFPLAPASDAVTAVAGRPTSALTFSLGGLSKASGLPQMKLGWIAATGPRALLQPALANLELVADTYLSAGTPVQLALPKLMEIGLGIRAAIHERVLVNRRVLAERIDGTSPCTLLPTEAGWSAILRVPETMSDEEWALRLMRESAVLVQPGYFFDLRLGATLVVSLLPLPPPSRRASPACWRWFRAVDAMTPFRPPLLLRSRHVQTIFATSGPRRFLQRGTWKALQQRATEVILDAGEGVRLSGLLSSHGDRPRDLVTVIHGWEGSASSMYVLSTAGHLYRRGFDVFRLHLRDHGRTHALNREPFTCTRLREPVAALAALDGQHPHLRHFLVGFSLGGNFALRMALHTPAAGVDLAKVVAVCPAILPHLTMEDLEKGFFLYNAYFLFKWKRSLRRKLALFPELGYGEELPRRRSLRAMNEYFVPHLTEFKQPMDYFMGYAIAGNVLAGLTVPSHILAAADDPVIDVRHLDQLARPACLTIEVTPHGGHCGFIDNFRMHSWADERIEEILRANASA